MADKDSILENYTKTRERIQLAAQSVGRTPEDVTLIVVTKGHSLDVVRDVVSCGITDLGENRVEEGITKVSGLSPESGVQWHMIGHVQSRKARQVCEYFNFLHSCDRLKLARRLDGYAGELGRRLPVLLQFNVSGEETKSGWAAYDESGWDALLPEIEAVTQFPNLDLRGLMTMAPYSLNPEDSRLVFVRLRRLRDFLAKQFPAHSWEQLSMGMSGDYEVGVQEGATLVRIGTAILGERKTK